MEEIQQIIPKEKKRKKKTHYRHIKYFDEFFKTLREEKRDFELTKTTYTRKVETNDMIIFYNSSGKSNPKTLQLINRVRKEGKIFLESSGELRNTPIDFFNLLNTPSDDVVVKIDVRSAYWKWALKNKVISKETDNKLHEVFADLTAEEFKEERTKILGSLATRKEKVKYIKGERQIDSILTVEPTRDLYMEICRGVDDLVKLCNSEISGCIYQYWDCMFISKKFRKDAVEFFRKKGYDVSVQETRLEIVEIGKIKYLVSTVDDKMYMTRRENKHLLNFCV